MSALEREAALIKLAKQGIREPGPLHWNLTTAALYEHAVAKSEAQIAHGGALVCNTGVHTGRSANDKFILREADSEGNIDWGATNKSISEAEFEAILSQHLAHYQGKELYVQDCWAGADHGHRLGVRVIPGLELTCRHERRGNQDAMPSAASHQSSISAMTIRSSSTISALPTRPIYRFSLTTCLR